jgi:hypothetical protein
MANWGSKNPSFHSDFKKVYLTLVKSALKKVFAKKLFFQLKILLKVLSSEMNPDEIRFGSFDRPSLKREARNPFAML